MITTKKYEKFIVDGWGRSPDQPLRDLYIMSTGLAGETGEVMEHLKKHVRNGVLDKEALKLELGDVLAYLAMITNEFGMTLDEIMEANVAKLEARRLTKRYERQEAA